MDIKAIAHQFVVQYYTTMMQQRQNLLNFYLDNSTLTYQGDTYVGRKQILEKFESFSFKKIEYKIDDKDVQSGPLPNSLLIFITGTLCMDDENTFKFSQVFNICPNNSGGLYCHNDIFRLVM